MTPISGPRPFAQCGAVRAFEQFYAALKLLNIDAVLVRVPEEPHGISRRPSHHITKILYVAGWFQQHKAAN